MNVIKSYNGSISNYGNTQGLKLSLNVLRDTPFFDEYKTFKKVPVQVDILEDGFYVHKPEHLPTFEEVFAKWDGTPPESYEWGEPVGREEI
jgi:hypothetical protein